jgi:hemerythrin
MAEQDLSRKVSEWERLLGRLLNTDDEKLLDKKVERKEFDALLVTQGDITVHFDKREEWLKENGYEVTRPNMRDTLLTPKQNG